MNIILNDSSKILETDIHKIYNYLNRPTNVEKLGGKLRNNCLSITLREKFIFGKNKENVKQNHPLENINFIINENKVNYIENSYGKSKIKNTKEKYFESFINNYGDFSCRYLLITEKKNVCDYINKNLFDLNDKNNFNEKNRNIIYHWLSINNFYFGLNDNTIFLTMNLIDRYISINASKINEFPLIALSCYFISTKYEDIRPPNVSTLVLICDGKYKEIEIIQKEYEILVALDFDILYNSSYNFLSFFHSIVEQHNMKLFFLSQFILEISLENIEVLKYSQSLRAVSALYISKKLINIKRSWNDLKFFYNYNEDEVNKVQILMIKHLKNSINSKNLIFEKFKSKKYNYVSLLFTFNSDGTINNKIIEYNV